jgi:adenylosuccinate lyase
MKEQGSANDLLERLAGDEAFANLDLDTALDAAQLVGRAPEQVDEFVAELVEPLRAKYNKMPAPSESRVRL